MKYDKPIVVVGSCMIDFISYAPRLPQAGETISGKKFVTGFGGKGANQSVAASKLGASVALIARLGDDIWGEKYLESLREDKVDVSAVQITKNCTSGVAQIVVSDNGENQIVIVPGANQQLGVDDIEKERQRIGDAAVVICQLETSVDVAIRALEISKGISILNGAPAIADCDNRLLSLPSIFCVNETEAEVFSGLPVRSRSEANSAALRLREKGCQTVVITLGAEGAVILPQTSTKIEDIIHVTSPVVNCVDSTGAGDAFLGSLAFLLANKPRVELFKCIEKACMIAADSVTKPGTQISFPTHEILSDFIDQF